MPSTRRADHEAIPIKTGAHAGKLSTVARACERRKGEPMSDETLPSISDSLAGAADQVSEQQQLDAIDTPNPVATTDQGHPGQEAKEKKELTREQRNVKGREDAVKRAFAKSKEKEAERVKAAKDAEKVKSWDPDPDEDRKIVGNLLQKHFSEHGKDAISGKELRSKEFRQYREVMKQRYPGTKFGDVIATFEKWGEAFQHDPLTAREAIQREYLKLTPQNFRKSQPKEYEAGISGSLQRARDDQSDFEELKPYLEKYGKRFPELLRQAIEFDQGMVDDPIGTSARLAAAHGGIEAATARQQQQEQTAQQRPVKPLHERTPQEDQSNVFEAVELIVQNRDHPSVALPGIEAPGVMDAMADALESGAIPRTQDRMADLRAAYAAVMKTRQAQQAEQQQRVERGSRSIVGSPSTSTSSGSRGGRSGIAASLERAFGRI